MGSGCACTGSCSIACASSCGQGCAESCAGSCKGNCKNGCGSGCHGNCTSCTAECSSSSSGGCPCSGGCTNDCVANCTYFQCSISCASCKDECGGCSLGCSSGCTGSCKGTCSLACNIGCTLVEMVELFANLNLKEYLEANNIKDIVAFVNNEVSRRGERVEGLEKKKVSDFKDNQASVTLAQNLLQGLQLIYGEEAISPLFKYARTNESIETILGNVLIKYAKQAYHEIV